MIALDYDVQIKNENYIYEIRFHVNDGSDSFPVRYVDMLRMLFKGFLHEFYYSSDTQIIIVRKENSGLEPDNDKYSCLLKELY